MKIESIQGLRGLAVAFVVLFHFRLSFEFGYLGVDVFFVISGFVITRLIGKRLSQGTFRFHEFYFARFDRLYAPAALMISASLITAFFILGPGAFSGSFTTAMGALFGVGNVVIQNQTGNYFASQANANLFLHTWSLGVEEQFYLVFPLGVALTYRLVSKIGKNWVTALGCSLMAASILAYWAKDFFVFVPVWNQVFSFYSPLGRAWEFAAGGIVYFSSVRLPRVNSRSTPYLNWFFIVTLILMQLKTPLCEMSGDLRTLVTVVTTSLLLSVATSGNGAIAILEARVLCWVGDRSYSIYLWHWPVYVLVEFTFQWRPDWSFKFLEIALTLMLAILSYEYVERRRLLQPNHKIIQLRKLRKIVVSATFVALLGLVYLPVHAEGVAAEKARVAASKLSYLGCSGEGKNWCLNDAPMQTRRSRSTPIYLVGDSNAEMYFRGLFPAAKRLHRDLISRTRSGCAPVQASFTNQDIGCVLYKKDVASFLQKAPKGLVILSLTNYYPNSSQTDVSFNREYTNSIESFALYVQSLGDSLAIVKPIPSFTDSNSKFAPELWPSWLRNRDYRINVITNPTSIAFDRAFTRAFADQQVFNPEEQLCPNKNCYVIRGGRFIWRDANHITLYGSSLLTRKWIDALSSWH